MKIKQTSKLDGFCKASALTMALLASSTLASQAADITWSGGTADYTNKASWVGGVVPGSGDNAINDVSAAVVNVSNGNPDWTVNDIRAGNGDSTIGAFYQDGPALTLSGWFRLGIGTGATGTYTLHSGLITINNDRLNVGELGTGIMNIQGGTINGPNRQFALADGPTGVSGTVNQTGGIVNSPGELWVGAKNDGNAVGNGAVGVYNLSGGTLNINNWVAIGRNGTTGTINMTGGVFTHNNNGQFLVGTGNGSIGTLNHSGGSITSQEQFLIPEGGDNNTIGTYNISNNATLVVNSWLAVGRNSGMGIANVTGGSITKGGDGGSHIVLGAGGVGTLNQTGGTITNIVSETWIGENSAGTWNLIAGTANLSTIHIAQGGTATGILNLYTNGILTTTEITTGNLNGSRFLNIDGGVIQASANSLNFIHDVSKLNLYVGGVTFDSQAFNIVIPQNLPSRGDASGGVTKIGTGKLTLTGANSYTGPTIVSAGTLAVSTSASGNGDYSVANGADLSVTVVQSQNSQLNLANLTLGTSAVDIDLGAFGNPGSTSAPLNASGTLALNGVVTLNIADSVPQPGEFPLISFTAKTGTGSFALGSLPLGVTAHLNPTATSINLVIVSVNLPRWDGSISDVWDTSTANWVNIGTGSATTYGDGNAVLFNDQATGTTAVTLGLTVTPASLVYNNDSAVYSLSGAGKISGSTGLTKTGAGTASILNTGGNNFTGPVVISGGVLEVNSLANGGAASAIGASSANPTNLVLAGGTLSYGGPSVTIDRGYFAQTNSGISTVNNLTLKGVVNAAQLGGMTKTGNGQLAYAGTGSNLLSGSSSTGYRVQAGSVLFDGSNGGQTNLIQNGLSVVGVSATASVTVTNATVTTTSDMSLGNSPATFGALTLKNGATLNVGSWFTFADSADSVGTVTMENGSTLNVLSGRLFLCSAQGTMCTFNINGGVINKTGDYFAIVDGAWNGSGARTGVVNQVGGTINCSSEMWIGDRGGAGNLSLGVYNLSGGTVTVNNWFGIGRDGSTGIFNLTGGVLNKGVNGDMVIGRGGSAGTFTMTGGTLNKDAVNPLIVGQGGGKGEFDQSGGTLTSDGEFWLGAEGGTVATNNLSGTGVFNINSWLSIGRGGLGVYNFSGGKINKSGNGAFIVGDGGTGVFTQTGGTNDSAGELWIAQSGTGVGEYDFSGGLVTLHNWLAVGREDGHGTLNITGGTMIKDGNGNISICHGVGDSTVLPAGTVNQTGGSFICSAGETWIGEDSGPGSWTISGGSATFGYVQLARNNTATGTLTINGGTVTAGEITTGSTGTSTLNLNGGTLAAAGSTVNFLHGLTAANVQAGGVTIDSGANVIAIDQPLLDGTGGGGLTKVGNGTLYLNGLNTYTGSSLVSTGALGGSGTIAGLVKVAAGAKLSPGNSAIGTLTVNSLILSNSSSTLVKISLDGGVSNDMVAASSVTYGGSLVVTNVGATPLVAGGTFHLFSAASHTGTYSSVTILPVGTGTFDPATGILTITSAGALAFNAPTVSGGNLILSGTGGTPGGTYNWLTATNLTTPVAQWTTNTSGTFGTTGGFTNAIPVSTAQLAQFFRLKTP